MYAGKLKKRKVYETVERYTLLKSMKAYVLVINTERGIIEHDKHIVGYTIESGKLVVLVINKWDVIEDKNISMKKSANILKLIFSL